MAFIPWPEFYEKVPEGWTEWAWRARLDTWSRNVRDPAIRQGMIEAMKRIDKRLQETKAAWSHRWGDVLQWLPETNSRSAKK